MITLSDMKYGYKGKLYDKWKDPLLEDYMLLEWKKIVNSWTQMGILLEIFMEILCCLHLMISGCWKADMSFYPVFDARLYKPWVQDDINPSYALLTQYSSVSSAAWIH